MKTPLKNWAAENLISALNFDSRMTEDVQSALSALGIGNHILTEFPGISSWRENVALLTGSMAALSIGYRQEIIVDDLYIEREMVDQKLRLRIFRPSKQGTMLPLFYWMHGGGLMGGAADQDDLQMKDIVAELGIIVVSVDYRLAPEYKFPTPLMDCYEGLMYVYEHSEELGIDREKIAIGGASAGGGLATALAILLREKRGPKIRHQSLTYPMLDDRNHSNTTGKLPMFGVWDEPINIFAWEAYLGTPDGRENTPKFSVPAREEKLDGLPSTFIAVGALDFFRDEDISYALRLMEAGVATELHFYPGTVHGFDWHLPDSAHAKDLLAKRMLALRNAFDNSIR